MAKLPELTLPEGFCKKRAGELGIPSTSIPSGMSLPAYEKLTAAWDNMLKKAFLKHIGVTSSDLPIDAVVEAYMTVPSISQKCNFPGALKLIAFSLKGSEEHMGLLNVGPGGEATKDLISKDIAVIDKHAEALAEKFMSGRTWQKSVSLRALDEHANGGEQKRRKATGQLGGKGRL